MTISFNSILQKVLFALFVIVQWELTRWIIGFMKSEEVPVDNDDDDDDKMNKINKEG